MTAGGMQRLVLVPVNGTALDERAIDLGVLMAKRDHAAVTAIYVVVVPQELPLEAEMSEAVALGEEVLRKAEEYAASLGRDIEIELIQARAAGPAIVDEALQRGASLIVMATSLWRRAGEVTFGRTTVPYVLKNAPCEVLVARRPGAPASGSQPLRR